ncbi:hypothetical protein SPFM12_00031 [Salmonella phage SPFM12]|nr:hypothetical protein SPFM12_00031 [Salmonella phage SPFM12]
MLSLLKRDIADMVGARITGRIQDFIHGLLKGSNGLSDRMGDQRSPQQRMNFVVLGNAVELATEKQQHGIPVGRNSTNPETEGYWSLPPGK